MKRILAFAIMLIVVGTIVNTSNNDVALASSESSNESEDNAAGDECLMGPGEWKELMERNPNTPEFKESHEDSVRSYEIKQYIDDNKDDLGVPDYFDDDLILCGIADDVQKSEKARGVQFTDEQLDTNIKLVLFSKIGDAASRLLENPEQYLSP
ncbi:MAG: hypothetical protein ACRD8W_22980 [Nitrososphaeraceae archaeon]